jgi:AcrR family transcriptional regulator
MAVSAPPKPFERRRLRQRDDTRRAILQATDTLLLEEGVERFSMRRLCDRCGYSAPTIYHHFGDKNGLLDELVDERFRRLLRSLRGSPPEQNPLLTLRAMAESFVQFGLDHPAHFHLVTSRKRNGTEPLPALEEVRELFVEILTRLGERGLLNADSPSEAGQSLWAMLHGLVSLQIYRPEIDWSETLVQTSLDALLGGLVRGDSPRPLRSPKRRAPTTMASRRGHAQ